MSRGQQLKQYGNARPHYANGRLDFFNAHSLYDQYCYYSKQIIDLKACLTSYFVITCTQDILSLFYKSSSLRTWMHVSGLQLRKSEQNGFHDNFLISQPNPMMWPSLKSSLRDDFNEW